MNRSFGGGGMKRGICKAELPFISLHLSSCLPDLLVTLFKIPHPPSTLFCTPPGRGLQVPVPPEPWMPHIWDRSSRWHLLSQTAMTSVLLWRKTLGVQDDQTPVCLLDEKRRGFGMKVGSVWLVLFPSFSHWITLPDPPAFTALCGPAPRPWMRTAITHVQCASMPQTHMTLDEFCPIPCLLLVTESSCVYKCLW